MCDTQRGAEGLGTYQYFSSRGWECSGDTGGIRQQENQNPWK